MCIVYFTLEVLHVIVNSVRLEREKRGLSQEHLASAVGVSRQTIVALEKGSYNPTLELSFKLAKVFGKTVDELFSWEEAK